MGLSTRWKERTYKLGRT